MGLVAADWLAAEGAGAIVLNARRVREDAEAAIARLQEREVEVRVELGDVTEAGTAERLVARSGPEAGLPPLGGVIFCVGVFGDGVLANQTWSRFEEVMRPKALGRGGCTRRRGGWIWIVSCCIRRWWGWWGTRASRGMRRRTRIWTSWRVTGRRWDWRVSRLPGARGRRWARGRRTGPGSRGIWSGWGLAG